jgi:MOSC domain-containing protein YiiM
LNLHGDEQADLRVHGGVHKAVYAYSSEHYALWRDELGLQNMPWGMFGENLTTFGMLEGRVCIGDRYRVGTAVLQVAQPRMPCFKLALRFNRPDMIKLFWASGRSGFYLSVVEEGDLEAGNEVQRIHESRHGLTVAEVVSLYQDRDVARDRLRLALESELTEGWKKKFRERLASNQGSLFDTPGTAAGGAG